MIGPVATRSAGATETLYCERCGDVAGPATTLRRVGLARCPSCGLHACPRCWARTVGACPGCGYSPAGAAVVAAFHAGRPGRVEARPSSRPDGERPQPGVARARAPAAAAQAGTHPSTARRPPGRSSGSRSAMIAAGLILLAGSTFAFFLADHGRRAGGIAGIVGTPDPSSRVDRPLSPSRPSSAPGAIDVAVGAAAAETGKPSAGRSGTGPATASAAPPRPTPGPTAAGTPAPTVQPTPQRTEAPTPPPSPAPTPAPCLAEAPQLVGERRADASRLWQAAGFSGGVTALPGHGNYVVATQDRTAGRAYPCDSAVTVGP
jgi:hypothetical protein